MRVKKSLSAMVTIIVATFVWSILPPIVAALVLVPGRVVTIVPTHRVGHHDDGSDPGLHNVEVRHQWSCERRSHKDTAPGLACRRGALWF